MNLHLCWPRVARQALRVKALATVGSTQWCDAALAARDAKARKSEAVVAAVDNFDLSELSEAAARIENAISWNDTDPQIVEYEDDDDEYHEEDVGWCTGDCDDDLDGTAYTVGIDVHHSRRRRLFITVKC